MIVQQRACDRNVFMNATHFRIALKEPRKVEPKFHRVNRWSSDKCFTARAVIFCYLISNISMDSLSFLAVCVSAFSLASIFKLREEAWDSVNQKVGCKMETTLNHFLHFPSCPVPPSGPQNLRVSEEWYNRLRITWDPPSSPVKGYRIVYKPVSGKSRFLKM